MPIIKLKVVNNKEEEQQSWTNSDRKAVHQRTFRQETTILKYRSLPHYLYNVILLEFAEKKTMYGQDTTEENVTEKNTV